MLFRSANSAIYTATAPGLTKNSGDMVASMSNTYSSGKSGVVEIINNVDLTPYTTLRVKVNLAIGGCSAVAEADGKQLIYLVCAANRSSANNWTDSAIYKAISLVFSHTSTSAYNASGVEYTLDVSGVNESVDVFFGLVWKQQAAGSTVTILEVELT